MLEGCAVNAAFMRGGVVVVVVEEEGSRSEGRLAQSWIAYFPPQQNPMTPMGMVVGGEEEELRRERKKEIIRGRAMAGRLR